MAPTQRSAGWQSVPVTGIEDLTDAVLGADLEATQMSRGRLSGSLAFAEQDGIVTTSGLIDGRVILTGPLSLQQLTIGIGVRLPAGTTHWQHDVTASNLGIYRAGDEHDSFYTPGSLYVAITLPEERLDLEAEQEGLVLETRIACATGVHSRNVNGALISYLDRALLRVHAGRSAPADDDIGRRILVEAARHLARPPYSRRLKDDPRLHGRIVVRSRDYIMSHLSEPISIDELSAAAATSRRTLHRAFTEILGEPPKAYVRRVRLHRIRHDLASGEERACTIALIANQWGISDLGRMAGWYREIFGERPSDTVARREAEEIWHSAHR